MGLEMSTRMVMNGLNDFPTCGVGDFFSFPFKQELHWRRSVVALENFETVKIFSGNKQYQFTEV